MGNSPTRQKPPITSKNDKNLERKSESSEPNKESSFVEEKTSETPDVIWRERLKAKDLELEKIKSENESLIKENQKLQSEKQELLDLTFQHAESTRLYLEERFAEELASSITSHQVQTKQCLQRICPSVSVDSSLNFKDWLNEFQTQAEDFRQAKVLVLGAPPEQEKDFADKESQCEEFPQEHKTIRSNVIAHLKREEEGLHPIKKSKSMGNLINIYEVEKNPKRKLEQLDKEEEDMRHNMLASDNQEHYESCAICKELARNRLSQPFNLLLNYTEFNDDKMITVIIDSNIIIDHMATVELLLATTISGIKPIAMIPFIVTKEIDNLSKEKPNKNKKKTFLAREAMKKLEELMKQNPRIVEQTLEQMKACSIWKSKKKNNDDTILECCIHVQKSGHNAILWSEDKNLRIKTPGHRILAFCTKDIIEIITTKSINPLESKFRKNKEMRFICQKMKEVPAEIIEDIRKDPKNAIRILTGMNKNMIHPSGQKTETTPGQRSESDLDLSTLFESSEKSSWIVLEDGNFCIDDGDDDIY